MKIIEFYKLWIGGCIHEIKTYTDQISVNEKERKKKKKKEKKKYKNKSKKLEQANELCNYPQYGINYRPY